MASAVLAARSPQDLSLRQGPLHFGDHARPSHQRAHIHPLVSNHGPAHGCTSDFLHHLTFKGWVISKTFSRNATGSDTLNANRVAAPVIERLPSRRISLTMFFVRNHRLRLGRYLRNHSARHSSDLNALRGIFVPQSLSAHDAAKKPSV